MLPLPAGAPIHPGTTQKDPHNPLTLAVVVRLVEGRSRVALSNTRPRNIHNQSAPWVGPHADTLLKLIRQELQGNLQTLLPTKPTFSIVTTIQMHN